MTFTVDSLAALEILDSRGRPTLEVTIELAGGAAAAAGVPSGASTGSREARELRDGDTARFGGLGVQTAVANVAGTIADAVIGRRFNDLAEFDNALRATDGTEDKSRLGANAIVGASMAAARAVAAADGRELWQSLSSADAQPRLPIPYFNVINGGAHAANPLDFQEFMIAPLAAKTMRDAVRAGSEIYSALRALLSERELTTGLGDEGGFAPNFVRPEEALTLLVEAIDCAGYQTGRDGVMIALDPAASEFHREGLYHVAGQPMSSYEMIEYYRQLCADFPICSIEDGLGESDWEGWRQMTDQLAYQVQIVGDDIFVTDPATIARAVEVGAANAALIKVNQIGTVTQALAAMAECRKAGWGAMVSHRSGETTDAFIADLAVGSGCGQIKTGAPARGERVSKYNRLLRIAASEPELPVGLPPTAQVRER